MIKNIVLLLLVLIPGIWLINKTWLWVNGQRAVCIGWNSTSNFQVDSLNQLGFRGKTIQPKKDSSERVILFVGDSQVEAMGLPFNSTMENLVQSLLQQRDSLHTYKCYSIGSGGFGQDQEFLALKKYFANYQADMVLLWLTPENDIWNNIFPTHWPVNGNPKPTFWLQEGKLLGPNYNWLEQYPDTSKPFWSQSFSALHDMDDKWESKLPLPYQGLPRANHKGALASSPQLSSDEAIEIEKSHYSVFLNPPSKRMEYGIQLTHVLLDSIRNISADNNARFSLFAALNNEVEDMPDSTFAIAVRDNVYTLSKQTFFENINAVTSGFSFHLFRLATKWKQISKQDNHHFNETAQREIANKIVDEILLPDTKQSQ